ncbi:hypothetical protein V6N11_007562 [Hibiscus sabdariffa]|uniref:Uncharacterized protein n=1 Tax=Hibiscus sabdariffa TaxID=183260 RepID=A0ABR2NSG3_9ROSI
MGLRSSFGNLLGLNLTRSLYRNTQKNMPIQSHSTLYFSSRPASTGISAENMPDSGQIFRGRFTNSAPGDAIVAALAGSECHQPGTASIQLLIWL